MSVKLDSTQILPIVFDEDSTALKVKTATGLVNEAYDNLEIDYIASGNGAGEVGTVRFKRGSSVVATITLAYNSDNKIISVTRA